MSSGHLREMVTYRRNSRGQLVKQRSIIPTFYEPDPGHSVFSGQVSLYYATKVFVPDGSFLPLWGVIMLLAIIYQALMVPYSIAFSVEDTIETQTIDFICTSIYLLDVLISCNTGFYKNGLLITCRKDIVWRYLRTWLVWDVVSSFPYDWIFHQPFENPSQQSLRAPALVRMVKISRLLRSLRLVRLAKLRTHLVRVRQKLMDSKLAFLFTSCYLLAVMLGIAHWIACGFYYVSVNPETTENWVYDSQMQDSAQFDLYIAAFYWTITTLTTTGYGDIKPINTMEKVYSVVIMLFSAAAFSVIVGKIGSSINMVDQEEQQHREFGLKLTRHLRQAQVPEAVVYRALRYMDYVWVRTIQETRRNRKTLDKRLLKFFSEPLTNEIGEHIYGAIISKVPAFRHFERTFISQLSRTIEMSVFAQDDLIFHCEENSFELYFIEKGEVEIFHQGSEHTFALLKVKDR